MRDRMLPAAGRLYAVRSAAARRPSAHRARRPAAVDRRPARLARCRARGARARPGLPRRGARTAASTSRSSARPWCSSALTAWAAIGDGVCARRRWPARSATAPTACRSSRRRGSSRCAPRPTRASRSSRAAAATSTQRRRRRRRTPRAAERPARRRGSARRAHGLRRRRPALTTDVARDPRPRTRASPSSRLDGQFGDAVQHAVGPGCSRGRAGRSPQPELQRADRRRAGALRALPRGDARSALDGLAIGIPLLLVALRGARARRPPARESTSTDDRTPRQLYAAGVLATVADGAGRLRIDLGRCAADRALRPGHATRRRRPRRTRAPRPRRGAAPTRPRACARRGAATAWRHAARQLHGADPPSRAGSSRASIRTRCSSAYLSPSTARIEGFEVDLVREIARAILGDPRQGRAEGR